MSGEFGMGGSFTQQNSEQTVAEFEDARTIELEPHHDPDRVAELEVRVAELEADNEALRNKNSTLETHNSELMAALAHEQEHRVASDIAISGLAQDRAKYRRHAETDELTGILNRRGLSTRLENYMDFAEKSGKSFAVIFADLDNFKKINDTFGHEIGDDVLELFAGILREGEADEGGRRGGDEFLLICDLSDPPGADGKRQPGMAGEERVEGITKRVHEQFMAEVTKLYPEAIELGLDISMAGAIWRKGDTLRTLVHRADQAMYKIKKQRNGKDHDSAS